MLTFSCMKIISYFWFNLLMLLQSCHFNAKRHICFRKFLNISCEVNNVPITLLMKSKNIISSTDLLEYIVYNFFFSFSLIVFTFLFVHVAFPRYFHLTFKSSFAFTHTSYINHILYINYFLSLFFIIKVLNVNAIS